MIWQLRSAIAHRGRPRPADLGLALALLLLCVCPKEVRAGQVRAVSRLQSYVRINTSNPPGNEREAALFLKGILEEAGIPSEIFEPSPLRANLYARLKGSGGKPGLLLHHHMDVVPAAEEGWWSPPFAARIVSGQVIGRGVLDDKMRGIAQLEAFLALKRSPGPLSRDVVFLATSDEEQGSRLGVEAILRERPAWLQGIGYALGEGGASETVIDRQKFFGIETFEKSALWIRIVATGPGGHGAAPDPSDPVRRIALAVAKLSTWKRPLLLEERVEDYFRAVAPARPPSVRAVFREVRRWIAGDPDRLQRELSPFYYALLTDTFSVTRLGSDSPAANVRSRKAWAEVDCRLLPSTDIGEFLQSLKERLDDPEIQIEVLLRAPAGAPSPKGELFELIRTVLQRRFPGTVVGPSPSIGISDNRFFRSSGIITYGVLPFRLSFYEVSAVHGVNERVRVNWFVEGVETMTQIVQAFTQP